MAYVEHREPKWNLTVGENYPTWPDGDSADEQTAHDE